jgi:hypothetical protein
MPSSLRMLKVSFQVCPPISRGTLVGGTLDLRLLLRIASKFGWWIISRFWVLLVGWLAQIAKNDFFLLLSFWYYDGFWFISIFRMSDFVAKFDFSRVHSKWTAWKYGFS